MFTPRFPDGECPVSEHASLEPTKEGIKAVER